MDRINGLCKSGRIKNRVEDRDTMKTYTKRGDGGMTDLPGQKAIFKDDPRLEACGTLDELNACLGQLYSLLNGSENRASRDLLRIQKEIMDITAEVASSASKKGTGARGSSRGMSVTMLEAAIDRMDAALPRLKGFIMPGGTPGASAAHVARTVCRRAERRLVSIAQEFEKGKKQEVATDTLAYMNRLSDYLFVLARHLNSISGTGDGTVT